MPLVPVVNVTVHPERILNRFVPQEALGAGVDGHERGENARIFTPHNLRAMRSAGLQPLTYRLRTELGCEAWHWNPQGTWSDARHHQGYWTSSAKPGRRIQLSYGYRLPRRGNTYDQANNDGYSRIDDGNAHTYWKSNPYLDDANPQWVVLDLGRPQKVDAIRLRWANPYALRYRVEYWSGENRGEMDQIAGGQWTVFPQGRIATGRGGSELRRLGDPHHAVRFVRLRLLASSHTRERTSGRPDLRDAKGFAIREVSVGTLRNAQLIDAVRHHPSHAQSAVYVSSTDPWHRASDRDPRVEQPGFDLVFKSGLTNGLPVLMPVPVLYGTPEDAAAEARWLRARGYPVRGFEMGEEPDGQFGAAEDDALLYLRMAAPLKAIVPKTPLGGPCFQTTVVDFGGWLHSTPDRSWMRRFLDVLALKKRTAWFEFFSFEWYPFDDVDRPSAPQLRKADDLLQGVMERFRRDGVSTRIPWMLTEYGYSAFAGPAEVDLPGALLNLDIVGKFLTLGGDVAYLYGYEPNEPITERRNAWGNLMMLQADGKGQARDRLPTYWAARIAVDDWCASPARSQTLIQSTSDDPLVTAYALRRSDGRTAVMLLNKDPHRARRVRIQVGSRSLTRGTVVGYGRAQYAWKAAGPHGHPVRSLPPARRPLAGSVELPPYSVTVVVSGDEGPSATPRPARSAD